jgi:hypothetical protein
MFHGHRWGEVQRYFVPPVKRAFTAEGVPADQVRELMQGVTVVELRCGLCGDLMCRALRGDATNGQ